jgi:hypothetical protein
LQIKLSTVYAMYLDNLERGEVIDSDFDLINLATWLYAL